MKIGIICEGERTDGPVLEILLAAEFPEVSFAIVPTSKAAIFQAVGALIDNLLEQGCDRVLVAWDLLPVGTQMAVNSQANETAPCQMDQRKTLLATAVRTGQTCVADAASLQHRYGFRDGAPAEATERIALICFSESFDAVFLSDPAFLRSLASSEIRTAEPPPAARNPTTMKRPQEVLRAYFRRGHNKRLKYFNKCEHNVVVARAFVEQGKLQRLRRHAGYKRLVEIIKAWGTTVATGGGVLSSRGPTTTRRARSGH
jgi:hypothetical protein